LTRKTLRDSTPRHAARDSPHIMGPAQKTSCAHRTRGWTGDIAPTARHVPHGVTRFAFLHPALVILAGGWIGGIREFDFGRKRHPISSHGRVIFSDVQTCSACSQFRPVLMEGLCEAPCGGFLLFVDISSSLYRTRIPRLRCGKSGFWSTRCATSGTYVPESSRKFTSAIATTHSPWQLIRNT